MEDDGGVRAAVGLLLGQLGHRAHLAADCPEMLGRLRAALAGGDRYDAVLFDLIIPGGPGADEALRGLREIDPQVPVIIYSGEANSPIMARHEEHGFAAALAKPFTVTELQTVLDVVLPVQRGGEA